MKAPIARLDGLFLFSLSLFYDVRPGPESGHSPPISLSPRDLLYNAVRLSGVRPVGTACARHRAPPRYAVYKICLRAAPAGGGRPSQYTDRRSRYLKPPALGALGVQS